MLLINPYRFAAAAAWTPAQITTALWLDAADSGTITTVSGAVSQWNDKSGNGRHVSQGTAANRPAYEATGGISGLASINWGTTASIKGLTRSVTNYSPARYFIVADYDGVDPPGDYVGLVTHNFAGVSDLILLSHSGATWWNGSSNLYFHNGNTTSTATAFPAVNDPFVLVSDQSQAADRSFLYIGQDRDEGSRSWRGRIGEIIALNSVPTLSERQVLEGYLAWKWGLQGNLPAGHPYKNAAPTA